MSTLLQPYEFEFFRNGVIVATIAGALCGLIGVFVVLKSLAALSFVLPQWEPTTPPEWLSRMMNKVPNVRPGERFEDSWTKDRAEERARRERNEQPWALQRR
jgi:hypothetical protein